MPPLHPPHTLTIRIVPMRYDADGSGRLPDTSPTHLERFRQMLYGVFPVAEVVFEVSEPVPLTTPYTFATVADALAMVVDLRAADDPAPNVYYYGLVVPTETRAELIGVGPTGIATTNSINDDPAYRAAIGIGYEGGDTYFTMAHELGHVHGRAHAPCGGAAGPDLAFPYPGGEIGVAAYDAAKDVIHPPTSSFDIMGYCEPSWVSDYNYAAFDEAIHVVETMQVLSMGSSARFERVLVRPDGSLRWLTPSRRSPTLASQARRLPIEIVLEGAPQGDGQGDGSSLLEDALWAPFDHVAGGIVAFRSRPGLRAIRIAEKRLDRPL